MKELIKYVSDDNTEFSCKTDCVEYEKLCERIKQVMSVLRQKPDDCNFLNGGGYIQHTPADVVLVKQGLGLIAAEVFNLSWLKKDASNNPEQVNPYSIVYRYISDSRNNCLNSAWFRLMCIDNQYREWGQIYFAQNPTQGTQKEIR